MQCHDCFKEYWQHRTRNQGEIEWAGMAKVQKTFRTGVNSAEAAQLINQAREGTQKY